MNLDTLWGWGAGRLLKRVHVVSEMGEFVSVRREWWNVPWLYGVTS